MFSNYKIIDLSLLIKEGMQTFNAPWHPKVKIKQLSTHEKNYRETRKIEIGTHTGTHIDAPKHFIKNGKSIDKIKLNQIVGEATIINFSNLSNLHKITKIELIKKINNKKIDRLIVRFDWDKKYNTRSYYTKHPYFSEEACKWLANNGCKILGIDTPQPDNPINNSGIKSKLAPNHKILLSKNIVILEYLANLRKINKKNFFLITAPLNIYEADGSPTRCFAIVEK